jgi:hypothetical protein
MVDFGSECVKRKSHALAQPVDNFHVILAHYIFYLRVIILKQYYLSIKPHLNQAW